MSSKKTPARERAVLLLFESDSKNENVLEIVSKLDVEPERYTCVLLSDYEEQSDKINELISTNTNGWTNERLPGFDRAVLRMAVTELVRGAEVPVGTIISESVELCERYSTPESPRFINGVLGTIAHNVRGVALLNENKNTTDIPES